MLADYKKEIDLLQEKIGTAQNILILTKKDPSYDGLAAALGLYLTLSKNGKKTSIVCSSELTVAYSDLVGVDKLKKEIAGKNFVISLDYQEGAIEKVSYNIENNKFNLVIVPREGSNWEVTPDRIQFNHQASDYNLIILFEIGEKEELNTFYPNEQELLSKIPTVAISRTINNSPFATINLGLMMSASLSEAIVQILTELKLSLDIDVATNLLKGIYSATNNLQTENVGADTFEALATCLKSGAQISHKKEEVLDQASQETLSSLSQPKAVPSTQTGQPPDDWLKPKIYKGTTLL